MNKKLENIFNKIQEIERSSSSFDELRYRLRTTHTTYEGFSNLEELLAEYKEEYFYWTNEMH